MAGRRRGAVLGLLLATGAVAQPQVLELRRRGASPTSAAVVVELAPTLAPHGRAGPIGWVTATIENPDPGPHRVEITFADGGEAWVLRDSLALGPSERVVRHYPLQRWQHALFPHLRLDREESVQGSPLAAASNAVGVLLVSTRPATTLTLQAMLEPGLGVLEAAAEAPPRGGRPTRTARARPFGIVDQLPAGMPDRWQCLAGFDLVVVDAGLSLGAERERVLLDYLAAGGAVFAMDVGSLGDGPLSAALGPGRSGLFGLGRWFAGHGARVDDVDHSFATWVADSRGLAGAGLASVSGPAPDGAHLDLAIPGLEAVPALAFFVLILIFVVVAGPVNVFLCKRAGRPVLLVLTLPALGFGFAAAILLWGMFSEGLGVKGAVRSITWLDQRAHFAVSQATQTLYAGTAVARLTPAPGTLLMCSEVGRTNYRGPATHRFRADGAGAVDGDVLPSRTPTTLVGVTAQRSRERLRFKRTADGGLETLAGPGLAPGASGVLVRDHQGRWFGRDDGSGVLRPIAAVDAVVRVREARTAFLAVPTSDGGGSRLHNMSMPAPAGSSAPLSLENWLLERADDLAPGSYLAWVDTNAAVDALGLPAVEWRGRHHLVLGLLAAEDIVD